MMKYAKLLTVGLLVSIPAVAATMEETHTKSVSQSGGKGYPIHKPAGWGEMTDQQKREKLDVFLTELSMIREDLKKATTLEDKINIVGHLVGKMHELGLHVGAQDQKIIGLKGELMNARDALKTNAKKGGKTRVEQIIGDIEKYIVSKKNTTGR
jgi:hypothetical protein